MNDKHMTDPDDQDIHTLYQQLDQEQPPAELDERILSAAHQSLVSGEDQSSSVTPIRRKSRSWYVPVSYVAIMLISLGVVVKLSFEPEVTRYDFVPVEEEALFAGESRKERVKTMQTEPGSAPAASGGISFAKEPAKLLPQPSAEVELLEKKKASKPVDKAKPQGILSRQPVSPSLEQQGVPSARSLEAPAATDGERSGISAADSRIQPVQSFMVDMNGETTAEDQVARMEQLLLNERYAELESAMKVFRTQYPDYALPQALSEWEKASLPASQR